MPVIDIEKRLSGSIIAVWEITETEEMLMQYAPDTNHALDDFTPVANPQRRLERLAVRALLNNVTGEKVYLRHNNNGRPFLANRTANISISHTKGFAAIIYNEEKTVGIDIEYLSRDFSTVEKKALSDKERKYLSDEHRNLQLCILWCAKEVVYKCVEENGIDFARQIFIEKFIPERKGTLTAVYTDNDDLETKFELHYKTIDDYLIVWTE